MRSVIQSALLSAAVLFCVAGSASAISIDYAGDSLHGATGNLTLEGSIHTWTLYTQNYDDDDALRLNPDGENHQFLTEVGFKLSDLNSTDDDTVSMVGDFGTLYFPSNVNQGSDGCDTDGSNAQFACVTLRNPIDATVDGTYVFQFNLTGDYTLTDATFRGKFGPGTGWIISETGAPIPEPSAALVFGMGAMIVGRRSIRR